ncbi:hypothetical protein A359_06200 [secondary endosymbiont of Ctenarytaina eucalypti]|uniref:Uncharacterized protein n=1 Tax=secondary endosymbiont of Ctenarytaina eucalypti TaxID=1199245 RepID=J3TFI9_9ENTR|nr:hypothetical protein A359_06200 [secondary endosymbiont of Ctenarytaina eucalypti]
MLIIECCSVLRKSKSYLCYLSEGERLLNLHPERYHMAVKQSSGASVMRFLVKISRSLSEQLAEKCFFSAKAYFFNHLHLLEHDSRKRDEGMVIVK